MVRTGILGNSLKGLAILGLSASMAVGADFPKKGRIDVNFCFDGDGPRFEPTPTIAYGQQLLRAVSFSNSMTGGPFDHYGSVCAVVYVQNKSGKSGATGHCENTDSERHKWVYTFQDSGNEMSGTWEFIGGTGKYEGATMSGDFRPLGPVFLVSPGHIQRCMKVSGSYTLR